MVRHLENEAQPDSPVEAASSCRACSWPTESLVDSAWQSVSKITLDLPWRPLRPGRQEEIESKGEKREKEEGEDQAGPATMTSRASNRK